MFQWPSSFCWILSRPWYEQVGDSLLMHCDFQWVHGPCPHFYFTFRIARQNLSKNVSWRINIVVPLTGRFYNKKRNKIKLPFSGVLRKCFVQVVSQVAITTLVGAVFWPQKYNSTLRHRSTREFKFILAIGRRLFDFKLNYCILFLTVLLQC